MYWAARQHALLSAAVLLVFPFISFAALSPGGTGGDNKAADACKSGSVEVSKGQISAGGNQYDNVIYLMRGKIKVLCRLVKPGGTGQVIFCDETNECEVLSKNSKQGQNLMEVFNAARQVGVPTDDSFNANPQDVLEKILTPQQLQKVESSILGRPSASGSDYSYENVLNTVARFSGDKDIVPLPTIKDSAIDTLASLADKAGVNAAPTAIQSFPDRYPVTWELTQDPYQLTDAYPLPGEGETSRGVHKAVKTTSGVPSFSSGASSPNSASLANQTFSTPKAQGNVPQRLLTWVDTIFIPPGSSNRWNTWVDSVQDFMVGWLW